MLVVAHKATPRRRSSRRGRATRRNASIDIPAVSRPAPPPQASARLYHAICAVCGRVSFYLLFRHSSSRWACSPQSSTGRTPAPRPRCERNGGDAHPHPPRGSRIAEAHTREHKSLRVDDRVRPTQLPQRQALAVRQHGAALDRRRDAGGRASVPAHHRLPRPRQARRRNRARPRPPPPRGHRDVADQRATVPALSGESRRLGSRAARCRCGRRALARARAPRDARFAMAEAEVRAASDETTAGRPSRSSAQPVLGRPLGRQSGSEPRTVARAGGTGHRPAVLLFEADRRSAECALLDRRGAAVAAPVYLSDTVPEKVNGR